MYSLTTPYRLLLQYLYVASPYLFIAQWYELIRSLSACRVCVYVIEDVSVSPMVDCKCLWRGYQLVGITEAGENTPDPLE